MRKYFIKRGRSKKYLRKEAEMEKALVLPFETIFIQEAGPTNGKVKELIEKGQLFWGKGLAPGSSGNLSFREGEGFVITATGTKLSSLSPEDFVKVVRVEGRKVWVEGKKFPSSETLLHWEVYRMREEINIVFHLHDDEVVKEGEKFHIPCTFEEKPGASYELAQETVKLLKTKPKICYFILRGHGIVSLGGSIEEATKWALVYHNAVKGLVEVFPRD